MLAHQKWHFTLAASLLVLGVCLVTMASAAGPDFTAVTSPSAHSLNCVAFTSASDGWVVGEDGAFHTVNGGSTWTTAYAGIYLEGISFADAQHGWFTGQDGLIEHTTDGGSNWTTQTSPVFAALGAVTSVDASHAWIPVVGTAGTILHTSDAGANWYAGTTHGPQTIQAVSFADDLHGWAVGDHGVIVHSNDGGSTWTTQSPGPTDSFGGVTAVDTSTAWAVSASHTMYHTTDGGSNWKSVTVTDAVSFGGTIKFLSPREGWACGYGTIAHTSDGGVHWTVETTAGNSSVYWLSFPPGNRRVGYFSGYQMVLRYDLPNYSVAPLAVTHGTISPSTTQTVDKWSDSPTFTVTGDTGYHVATLTVDGHDQAGAGSYTFHDVESSHTLSASFARDLHTITVHSGAHGSITPSETEAVLYGDDSATLTITPDSGYHVSALKVDGTATRTVGAYKFHAVARDHYLAATFAANKVKVAVSRTPSSASKTYKRSKGVVKFTLSAIIVGPAYNVGGSSITLQSSSDGKHWHTNKTLTASATGRASRTVTAKKKSTMYYRWRTPDTTRHFLAYSSKFKAIVK